MAPPSAKRRKLSPTPSNPNPASAPSTPSRTNAPQNPHNGAQKTPQRPSFASPTKASLAKHHPQVLEKINAITNEARNEAENEARAAAETNSQHLPVGSGLLVTPGKENQVASKLPASQNVEMRSQENHGPVPNIAVVNQLHTVGRSTRSAKGYASTSRRGRTSPSKSTGSTQPGSTTEENSASVTETETVRSAALRRAPDQSQGVEPIPFEEQQQQQSQPQSQVQNIQEVLPAETQRQEPELPPTPTQRGLADPVATTPPSGIHNTPSKRPKRRRRENQKPSPLKPRPEIPTEAEPERPAKRRKEEITQRIVPIDPNEDKRKKRDRLLLELQQLQADVQLAEKESERLHQNHVSGQSEGEPPNAKEVLELLLRSAAPELPTTPAKPKTIFQSISLFLPFSKKTRRAQPVPIKQEQPPSHLPLPLEDPLPHLQLFTPLTFTSNITILPPTPTSSDSSSSSGTEILQNHTITIRHPHGLFFSRIDMTVNTSSLSIAKLNIDKIDPNAEPEFGSWARERASSKHMLGRDVSAICWAMGQWIEVATKRARFWCALEKELGTAEGRKKFVEEFVAVGKKSKKTASTRAEEGDTSYEGDASMTEKSKWTRSQLLPQMKRRSLTLDLDGLGLRIEWKIGFDWTGEAENSISAAVVVSASWKEVDDRNALAKVPDTFQQLLNSSRGGPLGATKALVALLLTK